MNRRAFTLIQAAVTVVLLALLVRGLDWPAFRALFARLPLPFYALSLAIVLAGLVLYAWRWCILLRSIGARVPFVRVLQQYFVGIFVNNFLPSTVGGDAAKVYYLGQHHGYRTVTVSVVLDRLLGLLILATLATVVLWFEPADAARHRAARLALTAITGGLAAMVILALVGTGGLPRRLDRFGPRAVAVANQLQRFRLDLARAVASPMVWMHSIGTVAVYFALLTLLYQQFVALHAGIAPPFLAVLGVVTSVAVLSNIPVAINGLGLREQLHVLLLEPLGVPNEVALAISLLLFTHLMLASVAGGLLWWRESHAPSVAAPPAE